MTPDRLEAARFVFQSLALREGKLWLGAGRPHSASEEVAQGSVLTRLEEWEMPLDEKTRRRLSNVSDLTSLLERFMLKGIRGDSHMGLWGFISGRYALRLRHDIPTPEQMLERQCRGERYVSYLKKPAELNTPVGRFSGAYEFLLHDLEHAHKFFGDAELFRGQVSFFNLLRGSLTELYRWSGDPLFEKDLNYLKSDMNSHPVHLFKFLKAIVLTAELRLQDGKGSGQSGADNGIIDRLWHQILDRWRVPEATKQAALRINRPGLETAADQAAVHHFFKNHGAGFETGAQLC